MESSKNVLPLRNPLGALGGPNIDHETSVDNFFKRVQFFKKMTLGVSDLHSATHMWKEIRLAYANVSTMILPELDRRMTLCIKTPVA